MISGFETASIISSNNYTKDCHSREGGNPEETWIPGQTRNDKLHKTDVVMYNKKKGRSISHGPFEIKKTVEFRAATVYKFFALVHNQAGMIPSANPSAGYATTTNRCTACYSDYACRLSNISV